MSDARSNNYITLNQKKPFKVVVCAITLVAFFVNTFAYDLAWAGGSALSELTSVGSDRATGPGLSKKLDPATFKLPDSLGTIKDSWTSGKSSARTIIHIQDAHCNYYAQVRIAEIVEYLNKEYGINTINLEGGAMGYDLSPFTDIKDKALRAKVSDHFVMEGLVNGAELFAVNNPEKVELWGIEDPKLYWENLRIYRDSMKNKEAVDKHIKSLSSMLSSLKTKVYSKELFEFDLKYTSYKAGNLEFKDYLSYLINKARERSIDIKKLTDIYLLSQALDEESKIDFERANDQRDSLIDALQKKLSKRMLEELILKSVDFKADKISQKDYYSYLAAKAAIVKIDLKDYPELQKYIVYIAMYDAINKANVMEELGSLEDSIKSGLCHTDDEKKLSELSKNLALLKNIFGISITKQDYEYYKKNRGSFAVGNYVSFITDKAPPYGIAVKLDENIRDLDKYREDMIGFFEYSLKRDNAFLKNLRLDKSAIIITGGFHTENLAELFKKNDISYVSIMPNFRNEDGYVCNYYKLLSGEKSLDLKAQLPLVLSAALAIQDPLSPGINGKPGVPFAPVGPAKPTIATETPAPAKALSVRQPAVGGLDITDEAIERRIGDLIQNGAIFGVESGFTYRDGRFSEVKKGSRFLAEGLENAGLSDSQVFVHFHPEAGWALNPSGPDLKLVALGKQVCMVVWGTEEIGFFAMAVDMRNIKTLEEYNEKIGDRINDIKYMMAQEFVYVYKLEPVGAAKISHDIIGGANRYRFREISAEELMSVKKSYQSRYKEITSAAYKRFLDRAIVRGKALGYRAILEQRIQQIRKMLDSLSEQEKDLTQKIDDIIKTDYRNPMRLMLVNRREGAKHDHGLAQAELDGCAAALEQFDAESRALAEILNIDLAQKTMVDVAMMLDMRIKNIVKHGIETGQAESDILDRVTTAISQYSPILSQAVRANFVEHAKGIIAAAKPAVAPEGQKKPASITIAEFAKKGQAAMALALVLKGPKPAFQADMDKEKDIVRQAADAGLMHGAIRQVQLDNGMLVVYDIERVRAIIESDKVFYDELINDSDKVKPEEEMIKSVVVAAFTKGCQGQLLGFGTQRVLDASAADLPGVAIFDSKGNWCIGFKAKESEAEDLGRGYADGIKAIQGDGGFYLVSRFDPVVQQHCINLLYGLIGFRPNPFEIERQLPRGMMITLASAATFRRLGWTDPVMWVGNDLVIRVDEKGNVEGEYPKLLNLALDKRFGALEPSRSVTFAASSLAKPAVAPAVSPVTFAQDIEFENMSRMKLKPDTEIGTEDMIRQMIEAIGSDILASRFPGAKSIVIKKITFAGRGAFKKAVLRIEAEADGKTSIFGLRVMYAIPRDGAIMVPSQDIRYNRQYTQDEVDIFKLFTELNGVAISMDSVVDVVDAYGRPVGGTKDKPLLYKALKVNNIYSVTIGEFIDGQAISGMEFKTDAEITAKHEAYEQAVRTAAKGWLLTFKPKTGQGLAITDMKGDNFVRCSPSLNNKTPVVYVDLGNCRETNIDRLFGLLTTMLLTDGLQTRFSVRSIRLTVLKNIIVEMEEFLRKDLSSDVRIEIGEYLKIFRYMNERPDDISFEAAKLRVKLGMTVPQTPSAEPTDFTGAGSWLESWGWARNAWFTETGISLGIGALVGGMLSILGFGDIASTVTGAISAGGVFWFAHLFRGRQALRSPPVVALTVGTIAASLTIGFFNIPAGTAAVAGLMAWHYLNNKYFRNKADRAAEENEARWQRDGKVSYEQREELRKKYTTFVLSISRNTITGHIDISFRNGAKVSLSPESTALDIESAIQAASEEDKNRIEAEAIKWRDAKERMAAWNAKEEEFRGWAENKYPGSIDYIAPNTKKGSEPYEATEYLVRIKPLSRTYTMPVENARNQMDEGMRSEMKAVIRILKLPSNAALVSGLSQDEFDTLSYLIFLADAQRYYRSGYRLNPDKIANKKIADIIRTLGPQVLEALQTKMQLPRRVKIDPYEFAKELGYSNEPLVLDISKQDYSVGPNYQDAVESAVRSGRPIVLDLSKLSPDIGLWDLTEIGVKLLQLSNLLAITFDPKSGINSQFFESIKNAFFHGNKLDLNAPILISIVLDDGGNLVSADICDAAVEINPPDKVLHRAIKAGFARKKDMDGSLMMRIREWSRRVGLNRDIGGEALIRGMGYDYGPKVSVYNSGRKVGTKVTFAYAKSGATSVDKKRARELISLIGSDRLAEHPNVYSPFADEGDALKFARNIKDKTKDAADRIKGEGRGSMRILVIGVGTGVDAMTAFRAAKAKGLDVTLEGIDINSDAVEVAKANFKAVFGDQPGVNIRKVGEGEDLPDSSAKFDMVIFNAPNPTTDPRLYREGKSFFMSIDVFSSILNQVPSRLSDNGVFLLRQQIWVRSPRANPLLDAAYKDKKMLYDNGPQGLYWDRDPVGDIAEEPFDRVTFIGVRKPGAAAIVGVDKKATRRVGDGPTQTGLQAVLREPFIDGPHEEHNVVFDMLTTHKKEGKIPAGKRVLVLNWDEHSDKFGDTDRSREPSSTLSTWAADAEKDGLAYVPHFQSDVTGRFWNKPAERARLAAEVRGYMSRGDVSETWVTVDYDFFNAILGKKPVSADRLKRGMDDIIEFIKDNKVWPTRVIPVISRSCLPEDVTEEDIAKVTEAIRSAFTQITSFAAFNDGRNIPGYEVLSKNGRTILNVRTGGAVLYRPSPGEDFSIITPGITNCTGIYIRATDAAGRTYYGISHVLILNKAKESLRDHMQYLHKELLGRGFAAKDIDYIVDYGRANYENPDEKAVTADTSFEGTGISFMAREDNMLTVSFPEVTARGVAMRPGSLGTMAELVLNMKANKNWKWSDVIPGAFRFNRAIADCSRDPMLKWRQSWFVDRLKNEGGLAVFGEDGLVRLAGILARIASGRLFLIDLDSDDSTTDEKTRNRIKQIIGSRFEWFEDTGSGGTFSAESLQNMGIFSDKDNAWLISDDAKQAMICLVYKQWRAEYCFTEGEAENGAVSRFNKDISDRYGVKLIVRDGLQPQRVDAARYLIGMLPDGVLRSQAMRDALAGGVDLAAPRLGPTRIGHYDEERRILGVQPTGFTMREFAESFLHEFGHVILAQHIDDFAKILSESGADVYRIPALGETGSRRADYISTGGDYNELFAETFMHYILHGQSMSVGFEDLEPNVWGRTPNADNTPRNNRAWIKIYEFYRDKVFNGVEYRVVNGELKQIREALASSQAYESALAGVQASLQDVRTDIIRQPLTRPTVTVYSSEDRAAVERLRAAGAIDTIDIDEVINRIQEGDDGKPTAQKLIDHLLGVMESALRKGKARNILSAVDSIQGIVDKAYSNYPQKKVEKVMFRLIDTLNGVLMPRGYYIETFQTFKNKRLILFAVESTRPGDIKALYVRQLSGLPGLEIVPFHGWTRSDKNFIAVNTGMHKVIAKDIYSRVSKAKPGIMRGEDVVMKFNRLKLLVEKHAYSGAEEDAIVDILNERTRYHEEEHVRQYRESRKVAKPKADISALDEVLSELWSACSTGNAFGALYFAMSHATNDDKVWSAMAWHTLELMSGLKDRAQIMDWVENNALSEGSSEKLLASARIAYSAALADWHAAYGVAPEAVSDASIVSIDTIEARTSAVTEAFKDANGRSADVRTVQGIPKGGMAIAQTAANSVSRTLAKNGYGILDGTKQIYLFEIDIDDPEQTARNMEVAITKANQGLSSTGRVVIYAPQMDKGPKLADRFKQGANVTVLSDAYIDYEYPDMVARMALARNISFYYESNDKEVLKVISGLLEKIAQGQFKLDAIDDLFKLTIRIKPVDYNRDIDLWKNAQLATAVAA